MTGLLCFLAAALIITLSYRRASLWVFALGFLVLLGAATSLSGLTFGLTIAWLIAALVFIPLLAAPIRLRFISAPIFKIYQKVMPHMSRTEKEAIGAGTVSFEGELFSGAPNWKTLLSIPAPRLSAEEKAFLDGPVDQLCAMVSDWDVTHNYADLSPETWDFLKKEGFFSLIIPKKFGGREFSAYAQSQVIIKISSRSITASTIVAVPNSLGPAELLLHYGTEEQKNYYLPRLARGEEVPCFALTSREAGSDAGSMTDYGIVCYGEHEGKEVLGLRLTFSKRYITLAPIATVIGLAFKMYDPDHLIGTTTDIGITCALIPRNTPGIQIGRRHFPLNTPFQNGPVSGEDVFIPLDYIIGGKAQAGKGWGMLMECLAAGRSISLPGTATGGTKMLAYATGAYAYIRKQFNVSIGKFEGIEEPLARIGGYCYLMDGARKLAAASIDQGAKPPIASAIVKYHVTELSRKAVLDAMDIHGGKAICLGPHNYLARGFESTPIAITVEGANILTRSLIIFGQGAIRCHPYLLAELESAQLKDREVGLKKFDKAFMGHAGYILSNFIRTLVLSFTGGLFVEAPSGKTKKYYQQATRFSSALAMLSEVCMISLGSHLKRKESISARLGDILSYLYLISGALKQYQDQGRPSEDLPLVRFSCEYCLFQIQRSFDGILKNLKNRPLAFLLRGLIFPFGMKYAEPKDRWNHKIAQCLMGPTSTRDRLAEGAFLTPTTDNPMGDIQDALIKCMAAEPVEKIIKTAHHDGLVGGYTVTQQAQAALDKKIISIEDFDCFMKANEAKRRVLRVDDFAPEVLARMVYTNEKKTQNGTTPVTTKE